MQALVNSGQTEHGKLWYCLKDSGTWQEGTVPKAKNAKKYTVLYYLEGDANHNDVGSKSDPAGSIEVTIEPKDITATITPNGGTYGNVIEATVALDGVVEDDKDTVSVDLRYSGEVNDGSTVTDSVKVPEKAGSYTVSTGIVSNTNYKLKGDSKPFTIAKAKVSVPSISSKEYTGEIQTADIKETPLYEVKENKGGTKAGSYDVVLSLKDAANYTWEETEEKELKVSFTIQKAAKEAPKVTAVPETVKGQGNGQIIGVDSSMEYRKDGDEDYTAITGENVTGLQAGTYFVRYKESENYNVSKEAKVIIAAGTQLTITLPSDQENYTLTVDKNTLDWHEEATLTFTLKEGYTKTEDFAILVSGKKVELNDKNSYVIRDIETNMEVTVTGVKDTIAPTGSITIGRQKWDTFSEEITFDTFFNKNQEVVLEAEDAGSDVQEISYYLSHKAMTLKEIKEVKEADWTVYSKAFFLMPDNEYVIYVRVTDKAGNVTYLSSGGIVLDATPAEITGIESSQAYIKSRTMKVTDKYLASVSVDGKEVTLDKDGNYTLIPKNDTYKIAATDKAGNTTTVEDVRVNWQEVKAPSLLLAKGKGGNKSITISWLRYSGASGYEAYWSYCGGKKNYKKFAAVKNNKLTVTHKKLKNKRDYKYYIAAYRMENGKKIYLAKSTVLHVAMKQSKFTNAKSITLNKKKVTLKVNKTFKIQAKVKLESKKKKQIVHAKTYRYYTDNSNVAKVSKKGVITAKAKGRCLVYVLTNNGVYRKIKVTVK